MVLQSCPNSLPSINFVHLLPSQIPLWPSTDYSNSPFPLSTFINCPIMEMKSDLDCLFFFEHARKTAKATYVKDSHDVVVDAEVIKLQEAKRGSASKRSSRQGYKYPTSTTCRMHFRVKTMMLQPSYGMKYDELRLFVRI